MESETLLRRTLSTVALAGFALSLTLFLYLIQQSLDPFTIQTDGRVEGGSTALIANSALLGEQGKVNSRLFAGQVGLPVRLKIPKIKVDAAIEYVGLVSDGSIDNPKSPGDAAWFAIGPLPGESGSAVIDGHYGWKNGKAAVFDNLYKLRKGDRLFVEDYNGVITSFVMMGSRRYDPKADASSVFDSSDGKAHLNLITCEGVWDKVSKSYSERLVVFADKE